MSLPSWTSLPPSTPFHPFYVVIEHQIERPVLYSNSPLAICFIYGNAYVSVLLSQFILPSSSPT